MKPEKYPILSVYLEEIEKLHRRKSGLPLIFLIGATVELMLRDITDDSRSAMQKLIVKAEKKRTISHRQGQLFEQIRTYRNKYTHITADKILNEEISGLYFTDKTGLLQNVNEIVFDNLSESSLRKVLCLHIAGDSEVVYGTFKRLLLLLRSR